MRWLILDTYYSDFLKLFYDRHPGAARWSYDEQRAALYGQCFGTSDFYSHNLRELGHEAEDVIVNCGPLQRQWLRERAPQFKTMPIPRSRWRMNVVAEQVRQLRPDVIYAQDINYFDARFMASLKKNARLLIGQCAYELDWTYPFGVYDLIVTSFPHYVERLRALDVSSAYLRLGFDPRVLDNLPPQSAQFQLSFVGGFSSAHRGSVEILEDAARELRADLWGYGIDDLPSSSSIRERYQGQAWGLDMYSILRRSGVTINRHIEWAENSANNMRLYEGTGVGTCLLTDMKSNLGDLFEMDREVVAYTSRDDFVEKARYLVEHEDERAEIAAAGQRRTLSAHTYRHRMQELIAIVQDQLKRPPARKSPSRGERRRRVSEREAATDHRVISPDEFTGALRDGWRADEIPVKQRAIVNRQLAQMYRGDVPRVFQVAADALVTTGLDAPSVIEVGCSSAYYGEVLRYLASDRLQYFGIDYSMGFARQAKFYKAGAVVAVADGKDLPFVDGASDVVLSSGVLMHIPEYEIAVEESFRVSRSFVIFHRTPVTRSRQTTYLSKKAYGTTVLELIFNEHEIDEICSRFGTLVATFDIDDYPAGDPEQGARVKTHVFRKR